MLKNITIREYKYEDRSSVRELYAVGIASYKNPPHLHENQFRFSEWALKTDMADILSNYVNKGGNFWVAEEMNGGGGSRLVGCVGVLPLPLEMVRHPERKSFELQRVVVQEDCRGKGVGCALVKCLEDYVRDVCGGDEVVCTTLDEQLPACRFYEKNGYVRAGTPQSFSVMARFPEATLDGILHIQRFEKSLK